MWSYDNSFDRLKQTFINFLHHLPVTSGLAVLCIDDPVVREILPQVARPMLTYGFSEDADVRVGDFEQQGMQSFFKIYLKKTQQTLEMEACLAGKHNALNAAAAIAIALQLGVPGETIRKALSKFQGIGRRLQIRGQLPVQDGNALIIDDYGHHPREIAATLDAVRLVWPQRKLVLAFQPHRYTRTQSLFNDFVQVLSQVDKLVLLEVYSAGETPIPDINSQVLCEAIRKNSKVDPVYVGRNENAAEILKSVLSANDVLLLQGAGDIGALAASLPVINQEKVT
jgi:UDP-N-acetylmuramate--alanine ligase